jgi:hypothetical protein
MAPSEMLDHFPYPSSEVAAAELSASETVEGSPLKSQPPHQYHARPSKKHKVAPVVVPQEMNDDTSSSSVRSCLETVELLFTSLEAAAAYDGEGPMVDNLQFLTTSESSSSQQQLLIDGNSSPKTIEAIPPVAFQLPLSSPVDAFGQPLSPPPLSNPLYSPVPSPPASPYKAPVPSHKPPMIKMKVVSEIPPTECVVYPPSHHQPPPATRTLPSFPPPPEHMFAAPAAVNCFPQDPFQYFPSPSSPLVSEIPHTRKRASSPPVIPQDQKIRKKGKNSSILSNKRGKKHSNIGIEEELAKALSEPNPERSGVAPYFNPFIPSQWPRFVVINEDKLYDYILESRPVEFKLDKASLLEKFDQSRPCNRVNPKDRSGIVPIKYLRIDNRKKNPEDLKSEISYIKSLYSKQKIRIITHRDWKLLPHDDFTYVIKSKK